MHLLYQIVPIATLSLALGSSAGASVVRVTLEVDDAKLLLTESTTLHVWAQVVDGTPDNGIYAYALNFLEDKESVIQMDVATLLGDPMDSLSDHGVPLSDGLHDVHAGDGGYFTDRNRGLSAPFEVLAIPIQALQSGDVTILSMVGDSAEFFGIPDGFLLQEIGPVVVDFGTGVTIHVVPEPSSFLILGLASLATLRWRIGRRA